MPASLWLEVVDERRPVVQQPAIVDEEHLPRLESEFRAQLRPAGHCIECIERGTLRFGQRLAGFVVARLDPVTQIAEHEGATVADAAVPLLDKPRPVDGARFEWPEAALPLHMGRLPQCGARVWGV